MWVPLLRDPWFALQLRNDYPREILEVKALTLLSELNDNEIIAHVSVHIMLLVTARLSPMRSPFLCLLLSVQLSHALRFVDDGGIR